MLSEIQNEENLFFCEILKKNNCLFFPKTTPVHIPLLESYRALYAKLREKIVCTDCLCMIRKEYKRNVEI